jgi:hypothetical protein
MCNGFAQILNLEQTIQIVIKIQKFSYQQYRTLPAGTPYLYTGAKGLSADQG